MTEIAVSRRATHRRIWRLAGPIILANLMVPLLGAVDTAVVGHLSEPYFLGAVAVATALVVAGAVWGTRLGADARPGSGRLTAGQLIAAGDCRCGCGNALPGSPREPACFGCSVGRAEVSFIEESLARGMAPREVLLALQQPVLVEVFGNYTDPELPRALRLHIPRTISRFRTDRAAQILLEHLDHETDERVLFKMLRGLGKMRRDDDGIEIDASHLVRQDYEWCGPQLQLVVESELLEPAPLLLTDMKPKGTTNGFTDAAGLRVEGWPAGVRPEDLPIPSYLTEPVYTLFRYPDGSGRRYIASVRAEGSTSLEINGILQTTRSGLWFEPRPRDRLEP